MLIIGYSIEVIAVTMVIPVLFKTCFLVFHVILSMCSLTRHHSREHALCDKRRPKPDIHGTMTPANKTGKINKLSEDVISVPKKRWKILADVSIKNKLTPTQLEHHQMHQFTF